MALALSARAVRSPAINRGVPNAMDSFILCLLSFRKHKLIPRTPISTRSKTTPVHKDKNNVIAATLTRLTNKADTSGRITKALGDGP